MSVKKIVIILVVALIAISCASKFSSFDTRINYAVKPSDIIAISIDIAKSDLPATKKKELSLKLAKRAMTVFTLYIKYFTDKKQLPPKDDILDMLKYIKDNMDTLTDKETLKELGKMAKKLASLMQKSYLKF